MAGSFPAFLFGGDAFQIFVVIMAALAIILGASAIYKKKKSSEKVDKRLSSLRREFNNVKEESFNKHEDNWIENRLNADDPDIDDIIHVNKK